MSIEWGNVFAFERQHSEQTSLMVALNFGPAAQQLTLPPHAGGGRLLLSTALDREQEVISAQIELRRAEGVILQLFGNR